MAFNERLKQARKNAGFTQKEAAEELGLSFSTYSNYEIGRREPTVLLIHQFSKLFNVSGDWLLETGYDERAFEPVPEQAQLSGQQVYDWLKATGFVDNDEDLSDADLRFLSTMLCAIDEWFNKKE